MKKPIITKSVKLENTRIDNIISATKALMATNEDFGPSHIRTLELSKLK